MRRTSKRYVSCAILVASGIWLSAACVKAFTHTCHAVIVCIVGDDNPESGPQEALRCSAKAPAIICVALLFPSALLVLIY